MSGDGEQVQHGSAEQPAETSSIAATEQHHLQRPDTHQVPIIEVAFTHGRWWSMSQDLSARLCALHAQGDNAC